LRGLWPAALLSKASVHLPVSLTLSQANYWHNDRFCAAAASAPMKLPGVFLEVRTRPWKLVSTIKTVRAWCHWEDPQAIRSGPGSGLAYSSRPVARDSRTRVIYIRIYIYIYIYIIYSRTRVVVTGYSLVEAQLLAARVATGRKRSMP
jgi:hypothetical protein